MGRHRDDIQGLRATAVLLVVLAHAGVGRLAGGYVGVDVFFVLSGFLITSLLLAEAQVSGRISLIDFYARRARRILPAAVLALLATDIAATYLLNFVRAREVVWDSVFAAGFAANVRFADAGTDYFAQADLPSPLLHFWSLGVEEQFYLVWPAVLSLALLGVSRRLRVVQRRAFAVIVAASAASLAWSIHLTQTLPPVAYFSALTRAWELGLGAMLAVSAAVWSRLPAAAACTLGWSGFAAIMVSSVAFDDRTPFPGSAALLPTLGTVLVIGAGIAPAQRRCAVGRVLKLAPFRAIGDRSYSLYLWHWPVLVLAEHAAGRHLSAGMNLGLVTLACALAALSYALVENPIRRARWGRAGAGFVVAASAAAVLVTATLSFTAVDAKAERFAAARPDAVIRAVPVARVAGRHGSSTTAENVLPEVIAAVRAAEHGAPVPARLSPPPGSLPHDWDGHGLPPGCVPVASSSQSSSNICPVGATGSSKSIALIGDSHAQMWLPAVTRLAARDNWVVIPLLRPGCTPDTWLTNRGLEACRVWYRWALRQVRVLHPDVALVTGALGDARGAGVAAAERGTVSFAKALRPLAGRVIVIGDPEGLRRSPLECLLSRHAMLRRCMAVWSPARLARNDTVAARVRQARIGFIQTRGWFCYERRCPAVIGRTIVYIDPRHLTVEYSRRLSAVFRAAFIHALQPRRFASVRRGQT